MGFGKYLKTAFLNRWNLLAFLGSAAFACLAGPVDVLLPLILAAEVTYVGLLGANPKFQKYVDAREAQKNRQQGSEQTQLTLQSITRALPKPVLERFESLRARCVELRQIALELKHPGTAAADLPLDELQMALNRFLQKTNEDEIKGDIARLETRLKETPTDGAPASQTQRVQKALVDNLETSRTRLANLAKARDNFELVKLEIDRLENKIRSLSEMAINRQEPEFISGQVDQVARRMLETERTMNELKFATGLDALDEVPPDLLRSQVLQTK